MTPGHHSGVLAAGFHHPATLLCIYRRKLAKSDKMAATVYRQGEMGSFRSSDNKVGLRPLKTVNFVTLVTIS